MPTLPGQDQSACTSCSPCRRLSVRAAQTAGSRSSHCRAALGLQLPLSGRLEQTPLTLCRRQLAACLQGAMRGEAMSDELHLQECKWHEEGRKVGRYKSAWSGCTTQTEIMLCLQQAPSHNPSVAP